jgi:Fe-S cluster assembly iron-binding protein IscA
MLEVTERAKIELQRLLNTKADWPGARLRLIDRGNGVLGLGIDILAPEDEVVEHDGKALILVEPKLANNLKNITLDADNTSEGLNLIIVEGTREQLP